MWTAAVVTLTIRPVPLACIPGEEAAAQVERGGVGAHEPDGVEAELGEAQHRLQAEARVGTGHEHGTGSACCGHRPAGTGAAAADLPGYLPCVPADFRGRVLAALASVRPGEVVSYGDLAAQAGYPGAARGVGAVLAGSTPDQRLAWWRVVYADGRLAPGHEPEQARLLASEGVVVRDGRVVPAGGEPAGSSGRPAPLRRTAAGRSR